jgi:DNA uptake protein ComE-like DNA-binding protein|tara:strand:- start:54 stop:749 length:696 start_codon:yes stop_codon:yes gene_type:complete
MIQHDCSTEIWRDIKNYEGHYQVSTFGRVKSLSRFRTCKNGGLSPLKERILCTKLSKSNYVITHLQKDGKHSHPSIHRLVAETFIINPSNKLTVNHIDGVKNNNNVNNLEWATSSEQMQHAYKSNLLSKSTNNYSTEFKQEVLDYFDLNKCSVYFLSVVFNISERTAGRIVKNGAKSNTFTKISDLEVAEIIRLRNLGNTLLSISKQFNCGISQVHRITKLLSRVNKERNQ